MSSILTSLGAQWSM